MSIARKSMLTLAAALLTFAYVTPSFADLKITGVDGESTKEPPPKLIEVGSFALVAPPGSVCIYVLGTAICVSK
jgi:hypothetical protein